MGQTASSSRPEPVLKIDTAELERPRLIKAFRLYSGSNGDETVPDRSSATTSEEELYWDKQELIDFLGTVVPIELKGDLDVAGALLFKAMTRLGSFPFHNRQTSARLSADAAALAIIFLLRQHEEATGFALDDDSDSDSDDNRHGWNEEEIQQLRDRWFHRLLFQVMSSKRDLGPQEAPQDQDEHPIRDVSDDEHLIQARKLLVEYNNGRDERNPGVLIRFPPVIEVSELPSSRSRDLGGTIPKEEFQSLLNILCGVTNHSPVDVGQFVEASGIDWHGFEAIVSKLEVRDSQTVAPIDDIN
ncbi:hypothetical protein Hte_002688 [Hypoxylon texense]